MEFSLDGRTCALSVGEFAGFTLGPRDAGRGVPSGPWRAQLGQEWHARLRQRTEAEIAEKTHGSTRADAAFEVPLALPCIHRGWTFTLTGRIDQLVTLFALPAGSVAAHTPAVSAIIREIKTVAGPLPAEEDSLRAEYPEYFLQVITYLALVRTAPRPPARPITGDLVPEEPGWPTAGIEFAGASALRAELVFVELGTGITQTVVLTADDEQCFRIQLERLVDFLELQLRARERLRGLQFRPAFAVLRPGQESVQDELLAAFGGYDGSRENRVAGGSSVDPSGGSQRSAPVLFEAPTGYGKTGVLLEFALGRLRAGRFARLLYLTSKSTGQLQVMRTLAAMTAADPSAVFPKPSSPVMREALAATPVAVAAWQVRPKAEHCVNAVFHCVRDVCPYLGDLPSRWSKSGLARFYLFEGQPRDLDSLRAAGRDAQVCPYEITRTALPFNDVWVGDYNYVFSPDNRGVFFERPGFNPAETLLIVDEAHNLPSRVADAYSHLARAGDAEVVLAELHRTHAAASLLLAWEHWTRLLSGLRHTDGLDLATEDDVRDAVERLAALLAATPLDYASLGPAIAEQLWRIPALRNWLAGDFNALPDTKPDAGSRASAVSTLLWCPRAAELHLTCLDAAPLIGRTLRAFGGVILASATLQPADIFAANCGLDELPAELAQPERVAPPAALGKLSRRARKALRELTSGAELLKVEEAKESAHPRLLRAPAPWRDRAYAVGVDLRVDTTFQHRSHFFEVTAATVVALAQAASRAASTECRAGSPDPAISAQEAGSGDPALQCRTGQLSGPRGEISPAARSIAVFFPSYAYAENVARTLAADFSLHVALQPRAVDLAAQSAWVEASLAQADALFLVLGSSFAESIDLLGGRVSHAMVVGPALPEVNAIQRSRLATLENAGLSRTAAFRRVYQIPGMQKVNQALGRLVRAPGQHARVLLHCRRFAEESYASLLSPEYRRGSPIENDEALATWLNGAAQSDPAAFRFTDTPERGTTGVRACSSENPPP
jgi:Rad3-related DNA helicase